jgi:glyoxylase-like metal-dependent hydrolase (beta-lactamase superfamily II)
MFDFCQGSIKFIRGGRYPHCHSLLVDDQIRVVIDASSDREKLLAFHEQKPVDYLINTHAHEDHLIFNFLFSQSTFCAHAFDAPHFASLDSLIDCYGDMSQDDFEKWRKFFMEECHYTPRRVDLYLDHGQVMQFGETKMEVVHTPGHTRGHLCFYFPREKVLFTGDLDLTRVGPYYADRTSSLEETIQSLNRLKAYQAETYLTAHGKGIYQGDPAYIDRYLNIIFSREEKLLDFLKAGPKTLDEIVKAGIIYGQHPTTLGEWDLSLSEGGMMIKHLERLSNMNKVRHEGDLFILTG